MQTPIVGFLNSRTPLLLKPNLKTKLYVQSGKQYTTNRKLRLKLQSVSEEGEHIKSVVQTEEKKAEVKSSSTDSAVQSTDAAAAAVEKTNETEEKEEQQQQTSETKSLVSTTIEDMDDMFAAKELWEEVKSGEELGKRGEGFFLGQLLVLFLIFFPPFEIQGLLAICSVLLIIAGLVSVWLAVFNLGTSISPFPIPRKNNHLVTNGIYGVVRHPMYAGVLLVCSGLTLFTGGETRLLFTLLLAYLFNSKAAMEEKYMLQRYPEEYKEYMTNSVKFRFLPHIF